MVVSSRDCSRTASSRRQLCVAFTRSSRSSGAGADFVLMEPKGTAKASGK